MRFSEQQLKTLRRNYDSIGSIDPCGPTYPKLIKFLDSMDRSTLQELESAKIKWISGLARNRIRLMDVNQNM